MHYPAEPLTDATLEELAWLAGQWAGERGGDTIEEQWSDAQAGAMMGMFRWLRSAEKGPLYEFLLLEQEPDRGGVTLRLKHFGPGLAGWEEKDRAVVFRLVARDRGVWAFRQEGAGQCLVYEPIEEGGLLAYFVRDGETADAESGFRYVRLPL